MNLDNLKSDWNERNNELADDHVDVSFTDVAARVERLKSATKRRDLFETVAAIIVVTFFCVLLWVVPCPPTAQIGIGMIILGVIGAAALMHWTRTRDAAPKQDLPLLDFCTAEVKQVDRQIRLLRNFSWWYSAPILVGCCVFFYGILSAVPELPSPVFYGFLAAFYACFFAAGLVLHRGSRRAIKSELLPVRNELIELARSEGTPST